MSQKILHHLAMPGMTFNLNGDVSLEASQEFLQTSGYAAYLREVGPLLAGPSQVTALTPIWSKPA